MTSTLRSRLMSYVLGPAIVLMITISLIFTYGTLRDVSLNEKNIHQNYADQIAAHSYLLYLNRDFDGLQHIAQLSLEHSAIRSITFYDLDGNSLAHAGPIQPPLTPVTTTLHDLDLAKEYRRAMVTLPIKPLEISSRIQGGTANSQTSSVGWVQIQFSFTSLALQSYQSSFINIFVTIVLIALMYGITALFINKITLRIRELIKQVRQNDNLQLPSTTIRELDELQLSIANLKKQQIDKLNQAQQQLETAENDLYTTIEAIEIKNIELDIARREAVRSNKSKSEFLANTSHELRTPLNSIIGFSSLLMRSAATQQQREHARAIHDSSQNLLVLINDILDLSRLEANRFVLNNEVFDLRDTVESTLSTVASSAHLKQLELSHSIYSDIPPALIGDANRIRQILTNLLGNAIKFSNTGSVQLRVSLEHLLDSEAVIHFEVKDQGPGLPNGKQAVIFAPFTQFDNSNTREESGSGLGLSICHKLIQQMNGDLDYHSEPGNTRFWFTVRLPIASDDQAVFDTTTNDEKLRDDRIVVIDELSQSRNTTSHLLESFFNDIAQFDDFNEFLSNPQRAISAHDIALIAVPVNTTREQLDQLGMWCKTRQQTTLLALPCTIDLNTIAELPTIRTLTKPVTRQRLLQALSSTEEKTAIKSPSMALHSIEQHPAQATAIVSDALKGVRILIADDMPNNALLFDALLSPHGAEITFTENGEQALAKFRSTRFDIVMLDIQMPIMDGLQACQLMRKWEQEQQVVRTPILAVTAFSDNEQRSTIESVGMDDLLTKPIDEQRLFDTITRYLSKTNIGTKKITAPSEQANGGSIFSYDAALKRCSNRHDIVQSMVLQLLQILPEERTALLQAINEKKTDAMQQIAHKLYGASGYCGTEQLMQCSKALDKLCRVEGETTLQQQAATELVEAIDTLLQFSQTDRELQQLLNSSATPQ